MLMNYKPKTKVSKNNADIKIIRQLGKTKMNKRVIIPTSNISQGVEFFLRGAKKRRAMAIASVRQVNTDIGVNLRPVAVK